MTQIFFFIDQISIGLYLLLAVAILWQSRHLMVARGAYRSTYFELERDLARYNQLNALTIIAVFILFGVAVLGVQQSVVPFLRSVQSLEEQAAQLQESMTDGVFNTATPPALGGGINIEPVPPLGGDGQTVLLLTPTLTPTPVGTIVPNAPAIEGCQDERAQLELPANGMRVFSPIAIIGTAYADSFARVKIEINGPSTGGNWAVIDEQLQPVRNRSPFSQFAPSEYIPGLYRFRTMVFDISDSPVASCMVNIYISDPPVTATPTAQPSVGS